MALSDKRLKFVREYVKDFNATKAAERAGYSPRSAPTTGYRLLKNVEVQKAIQAECQRKEERAEINRQWVVNTLVENVQRGLQKKPVLDREGNETGEWVYSGAVVNKALELLGKDIGMWKDNGSEDRPFVVKVVKDDLMNEL